jgi:Small-conductance mechanosensitive channel
MLEEVLKLLTDSKFIKVLTVLLMAFVVSFIVRTVINFVVDLMLDRRGLRHKEHQKRAKTLASAFSTFSMILIWVLAFLIGLNVIGVRIETLATSAGLFGVIISFGAQNAIRDIVAGVFIIAENQFRVGDVVKFYYAGQQISGKVEEISIRVTKLRDIDGNLHIIRNGFSEIITNRTFNYANANIELLVAYDTDIDKLESVINEVGSTMIMDPMWREKIIQPIQFTRVAAFENSAIRVKALGQVEAAEQWKVSGEFLRRIKKAFEQNHIVIPFEQVVVHQAKK